MRRTAITALVISISLLVFLGLVMLYSTTSATHGERMLVRQTVFLVAGVGLALVMRRFDYQLPDRWLRIFLAGVGVMLAYLAGAHVLYRLGVPNELLSKLPLTGGAINGAFRWLTLPGGINLQPSELAKVALIVFVARYYHKNHRYAGTFKQGLLRPMWVIGPIVAAIFLSGSLSLTLITCAVVSLMMFVAGVQMRYFLAAAVAVVGLVGLAVTVSPERMERLVTFRNPEAYRQDAGYQLFHSQLALGSGGWNGIGFNESRMKEHYLPEAHTDFIMAIVGEELGFSVVALIMALYLIVVGAAFTIAVHARDREGMLLAFGIGCSFGIHAFINLAVVSGFMPTTGITAPLISYGGSSMIVTWLSLGLLGAVARTSAEQADGDEKHPLRKGRRAPVLSA